MRRAALVLTLVLAAGAALEPGAATAAPRGPVEWIEVGDPILAELEVLTASGLVDSAVARFSGPRARRDVATVVARARRLHPASREPSLIRLERAFARELVAWGWPAPVGSTPPLLAAVDEPGDAGGAATRQELFGYVDATLEGRSGRTAFMDRSRFGGRLNVASGGLLVHLDLWAGRVDDAARFTDVLVTGSEFAAHSEDSYLSYATGAFDVTLGRRRSAFGPGFDGTLLWSPEAAPVTSLALGATLFRHVRATSLHGDIDAARDARIAAHRLEWFPSPAFTLGLHEAARYTSSQWEPLYLVPLLPFTFVQRLHNEDALDRSGDAADLRNNVMAGLDLTWRPGAGSRLHGELLLDDQNLRSSGSPTRLGYQLGGLATRALPALGGAARGTLRLEYSRVYNYVYSTFYGESFIHHDRPIGFPEGPDSGALHGGLEVATSAAFEFRLAATWVDRGEGELGRFFHPDSGDAAGSVLSGAIEHRRTFELGARYLPRDGVDVSASAARQWVDDVAHQAGIDERRWIGPGGAELATMNRGD